MNTYGGSEQKPGPVLPSDDNFFVIKVVLLMGAFTVILAFGVFYFLVNAGVPKEPAVGALPTNSIDVSGDLETSIIPETDKFRNDELSEIVELAADGFSEFVIADYRFDYPSIWSVEEEERERATRYVFTDDQGAEMMKVTCPIVETGYEAWRVTDNAEELFGEGDEVFLKVYDHMVPTSDAVDRNLLLVIMGPGISRSEFGEVENFGRTCQILGEVKEDRDILQSVYESITSAS